MGWRVSPATPWVSKCVARLKLSTNWCWIVFDPDRKMLRTLHRTFSHSFAAITAISNHRSRCHYEALLTRLHTSCRAPVSIQASPQVCLHDVHTTITVQDLPPNSPVSIRAHVYNDNDKKVNWINLFISFHCVLEWELQFDLCLQFNYFLFKWYSGYSL